MRLTRPLIIGGIQQFLYIKGDPSQPLLLFLHGGPGFTELGLHNWYLGELEKHFLVVHWDQRGAGQSFHPHLKDHNLTKDKLMDDLKEIISHLLLTYRKKALILAGHSMGSALGFEYISRDPSRILAYIGINQIVNREAEELQSYVNTIQLAEGTQNKKAADALRSIAPPVNGCYRSYKELAIQRNWLVKLGGFTFKKRMSWLAILATIFTKEYPWSTRLRLFRSMKFSMEALWTDFSTIDFLKKSYQFPFPVILMTGQHDNITFSDTISKLVQQITAPHKKLIVFEYSGHLLCYEENKKFIDELITIKKSIYEDVDAIN